MSDQLKHGIAGGMAGIAVDLVFYPLETIKTRIMASSSAENLRSIAVSRFRGFSCQMLVSFPYSFSFFYTYGFVRSRFQRSAFANMFASVCAEIVANIVRNPFEVVKQQMMVGRSDRIWQSLKEIQRNRGFSGFYIGYKPTLARDIVFSAMQLPLFEFFREKLMQQGLDSVPSAALGGMMGAMISGFFSCPLDVIKTRLMTQKMGQENPRQIIQQIYKEFGLKGFFRGAAFRCGILTFGGSIYFGALQKARELLQIQ